ncbi:MAG: type III-A CRISPR-associated RAMP protein Csm5 [bacterium]|jgi:CRISPR-associated protein Csm5
MRLRYRLTCLTPTLTGDGRKLSPIDYMVWRDQVNVLDQTRILKLLAKGPRLEGYLSEIRKAEKLEFAAWGGFAQNYADRRIPFEHPSLSKVWSQVRGETLSIPTFATGTHGPYVPGSAIKGALRTGMLFARWSDSPPKADFQRERLPRRPGEASEEQALGPAGTSYMRALKIADSAPAPANAMRVYMLRTSTLVPRGQGRFDLGWKQAPRATVARADDATPTFAEMAAPGTVFEGTLQENQYLVQPEIARLMRWRGTVNAARVFDAANAYAEKLLAIQKQYAERAGLEAVLRSLEAVEARLAEVRGNGAVLAIGWGSGFLSKTGWLDTDSDGFRNFLRQIPLYARAIESGLPFPKTRRIVFMNGEPAALPGWVTLEVSPQ